jgi:GAF domain-containing protein
VPFKVPTNGARTVEKLERELSDARRREVATAEVLRAISRSPTDVQPVFDAIVTSAIRLLRAHSGTLTRLAGDQIELAALTSTDDAGNADLRATFPRSLHSEGSHAQAIRDRAPLNVADTEADLRRPEGLRAQARARGYRSAVAVPLLRHDEAIGAIAVTRREPGGFTDDEIALLQTFADQAVIAIENTRLFEAEQTKTRELSEALEQQTATSEVLKAINSSTGELQPLFQVMLANAMRVCEANFGFMNRYDGHTWKIVARHGGEPAYPEYLEQYGYKRPGPETVVARIARTKETVQVVDLMASRGYKERDPVVVAAVELGGVRTLLGVPMLREDQLVGAIMLYRQEIRLFNDKQITLVQNFAAQAVIAIENTRLLSELRESLQQQTATANVLKVISRSTLIFRSYSIRWCNQRPVFAKRILRQSIARRVRATSKSRLMATRRKPKNIF